MTYAEMLLPDFDSEMASTRKVLERVPDDKLDWQPHPKSRTIGWNANHIADLVNWLVVTLTTPSFDIAPPGGPRFEDSKLTSRQDILALFDRNVAKARQTLAAARDEDMGVQWTLLQGGQAFMSMPRADMVRGMLLNHLIHHRAILCVYLRLNNVPVPGMYGPSGDE